MTSYVVPSTTEPSFWNKTNAIGAMVGFSIGSLPGAAVGSILGGLAGKHEQLREKETGHIVSEPSAWNKDTALGVMTGSLLGSVAAGLIATAGLVAASGSLPIIAGAGALATVTWVGSTILGGYIGGKHGKEAMQQEYDAVVAGTTPTLSQTIEKQHTAQKAQEQEPLIPIPQPAVTHADRVRASQATPSGQSR